MDGGTIVAIAAIQIGLFAWLKFDISKLGDRMGEVEKAVSYLRGRMDGPPNPSLRPWLAARHDRPRLVINGEAAEHAADARCLPRRTPRRELPALVQFGGDGREDHAAVPHLADAICQLRGDFYRPPEASNSTPACGTRTGSAV